MKFLWVTATYWLTVLQHRFSKYLAILDPLFLPNAGINDQQGKIFSSTFFSNHKAKNPSHLDGCLSTLPNYQFFNYDLIGIFSPAFWQNSNEGLFKHTAGIICSILPVHWSSLIDFVLPVGHSAPWLPFLYWKFFYYLIFNLTYKKKMNEKFLGCITKNIHAFKPATSFTKRIFHFKGSARRLLMKKQQKRGLRKSFRPYSYSIENAAFLR